jgi:hypothetical protein
MSEALKEQPAIVASAPCYQRLFYPSTIKIEKGSKLPCQGITFQCLSCGETTDVSHHVGGVCVRCLTFPSQGSFY